MDYAQRIINSEHSWLIIGSFGSAKDKLFQSLQNCADTAVSLEVASAVIAQERKNDDSEFSEGGVDVGRTVAVYLREVLPENVALHLETLPEVKLCGIEQVLHRGLKYLSTGEMRRTLLCRALLTKSAVLLLSDPLEGLDAHSRAVFTDFFELIASNKQKDFPRIILCTERFSDIPPSINRVLEFEDAKVIFCGERKEYEKLRKNRNTNLQNSIQKKRNQFLNDLDNLHNENLTGMQKTAISLSENTELVRFHNVRVAWGDNKVLDKLNWSVYAGEHWLIRGPNGSGKTTLLELITGDNTQVYCNDVTLFGKRRGTGETIWDIKKNLGIVSYRLHLEYRLLGSIDIEAVVLSGFHDTIGLYEKRSHAEQLTVKKWLHIGGFAGRENENFANLSYGEQRAILILRAAVKGAAILILDEPCHALDDEWRTKTLDLMDCVAETGTSTVLHVTHDPTEIRPFEKHILELCPNASPMYRIITE